MKKSLGPKTLAYLTPVWVIGTYDSNAKPNMMTASWGGICCSKPPCLSISLRKATYSFGNIVQRKAFTVNIPSETQIKETDYFGMVSGKAVDKISRTGLTAVKSSVVDAPYLDEFSLVLECKLIHSIELGLHTQFVGEIVDVKAEAAILNDKGLPDAEALRPFAYIPETESYFGLGNCLGHAWELGGGFKE